jgi:toxin CcdB
MAQFDTFANPIPGSRRVYPFVVCLQSTLLAGRENQVVAPLAPRKALAGTSSRLAPVISIDDAEYAVLILALMTLPARDLEHRVANLASYRNELLGAADLLFYGV